MTVPALRVGKQTCSNRRISGSLRMLQAVLASTCELCNAARRKRHACRCMCLPLSVVCVLDPARIGQHRASRRRSRAPLRSSRTHCSAPLQQRYRSLHSRKRSSESRNVMLCPRSLCLNGSTGFRPWCCAQSSCRALHSPVTCLSHSIKLLGRPAMLRIALSGETHHGSCAAERGRRRAVHRG